MIGLPIPVILTLLAILNKVKNLPPMRHRSFSPILRRREILRLRAQNDGGGRPSPTPSNHPDSVGTFPCSSTRDRADYRVTGDHDQLDLATRILCPQVVDAGPFVRELRRRGLTDR